MKLREYLQANFTELEIVEKVEKILELEVLAYHDFIENGRDSYYSIILDKTSYDRETKVHNNWVVNIKKTKNGLKTYLKTGYHGMNLEIGLKYNHYKIL